MRNTLYIVISNMLLLLNLGAQNDSTTHYTNKESNTYTQRVFYNTLDCEKVPDKCLFYFSSKTPNENQIHHLKTISHNLINFYTPLQFNENTYLYNHDFFTPPYKDIRIVKRVLFGDPATDY